MIRRFIDQEKAVGALEKQAEKGEANLVLMGIQPTYPSEKYGYIIPESKDQVSKVSCFKEKPDEETVVGTIYAERRS